MKKTPLKRGNKQLKRTPFKKKYSRLNTRSTSETSVIKEEIQALLRQICILRDSGCVLRHYKETGACGGYRKDGELILQFDHLNSRTHSISYGDPRLGVCLCQRHHIFWKKQNPALFMDIIRKHIGKERSNLLDKVIADKNAYKMDWKLVKVGLISELNKLSTL